MTASFLTSLFASGYPLFAPDVKGLLRTATALGNMAVFNSNSCATTITSTSYTDIANSTLSFTKQLDSTLSNVLIIAACDSFSNTASRQMTVGVNNGSADTDLATIFANTANEHLMYLGGIQLTTMEPAAYTLKLRGKLSGTGSLILDGNSTVSYIAWEVPK